MQSHYQNNAYRILGLPGNASRASVQETAISLRLRARLAMPAPHADPLGRFFPLQFSESLLDDALRRLQNPARRIQERLFWFTSADSVDADCWKNLERGDLAFAKAGWSQSTMISRRANTARTSHLFAITAAPSEFERKHWATALGAWKRLLDLEGFWKFQQKLEADAGFLPPAIEIEFARLRAEAPRIFLHVHASAVSKALERAELDVAAGHLAILRSSEFPRDLLSNLENASVERFGSRLEQAVQDAGRLVTPVESHRAYHQSIKPGWRSVYLENRTGTAAALRLGEVISRFLLELADRFLNDSKPNLAAECVADAVAITAGTPLARRQEVDVNRTLLAIQAQRQRISAQSAAQSTPVPSVQSAPRAPVPTIQAVSTIPWQESANAEEERLLKESRYGLLDNLVRVSFFPNDMYIKVVLLIVLVFSQLKPPWTPAAIPSRPEMQAQTAAGVAVPSGYVIDKDPIEELHVGNPVQNEEQSFVIEEEEEEEDEEEQVSEDDSEIVVTSDSEDEDDDGESQGENDESDL